MANLASLIVKIGANDAEIQKSLEKLGTSVKRTDADFKKLGNSPIAQQAQKSLESLNATIKGVTDSQQRLADRATLAARGLTAIGGPARLTTTELTALNRTIQQGLDAFRALGQQAPTELRKVAAAIQQQQKLIQQTGGGALFGNALSGLPGGHVLGAFASGGVTAGLAVGLGAAGAAFTLAAKNALTYADALGKMKASTDISFQGLQQLENIAVGSDTTLQALTSSVLDLQRRLASGDDSAEGALKRLGFSLQEFLALKGDEQFLAIARSLGAMTNEQDRNLLAFQLFGRSYKEILSALVSDVDALGASVKTLTDEQVARIAELEDRWQVFLLSLKREGLETFDALTTFMRKVPLDEMGVEVNALQRQYLLLGYAIDKLPKPGEIGGARLRTGFRLGDVDLPSVPVGPEVPFERIIEQQDAAAKALEATTIKLAAAQRTLMDQVRALNASVNPLTASLTGLSHAQVVNVTEAERLKVQLAAIEDATIGVTAATQKLIPGLTTVNGRLADIERASIVTAADLVHLGQVVTAVASTFNSADLFSGLLDDILGAIQGGGNVLAAAAFSLGQKLGKAVSAGMVQTTAGQQFAASAVSAIATFGVSYAFQSQAAIHRRRQAIVDEFEAGVRLAEALLDIADAAVLAGRSIDELNRSGQTNRAIFDEWTAAIDFQDAAMRTLEETVGRYNFTMEEKGPAIALREQTKIAEQLLQDWRLLTAAGVDVAAVAREMAASTNLYVQNALKMGQEIPEFMRAQILKMIELGLLYDANGVKITSLEGSGITFSQSMTANVDRIILKIQALIEAIDRGLGNVIRNVPPLVVDVWYNDPGFLPPGYTPRDPTEGSTNVGAMGGLVTTHGIQAFASGGRVLPFLRRGMDTVPAMLTPGEWVLNRSQQEAIRGALSQEGRGPVIMQVVLDRRVIAEAVLDETNSGGSVRSKFNSLVKKAD